MAELQVITELPKLAARPRDGHKGTFGRVFIVGGSRGMVGAPCLAARAALRSGAGLVQVGVPAGIVAAVSGHLTEATVVPLSGQGALEMNSQNTIMEVARGAAVVIYGPGLGPGPGMGSRFSGVSKALESSVAGEDGSASEPADLLGATKILTKRPSLGHAGPGALPGPGVHAVAMSRAKEAAGTPESEGEAADDEGGTGQTAIIPQQAVGLNRLTAAIVQRLRTPLILDADGLNAIASRPLILASRRGKATIITPHPGEMARITNLTVEEIQKQREKIAAEWALKLQSIVVLKGAGTVVTDGRKLYVNTTGNPGMATGGSGDALTGVIGALIGQGLNAFDAAVLGVYVHGLAGDLAAGDKTEIGMIAGDIIEHLPMAWKTLQAG